MIAQLKEEIVLLTPAPVPDGGGGTAPSFSETGGIAAAIISLPARTIRFADRRRQVLRREVTIRYRSEVTLSCRLHFRALDFDIVDLRPDRDRRFLTLIAQERAS